MLSVRPCRVQHARARQHHVPDPGEQLDVRDAEEEEEDEEYEEDADDAEEDEKSELSSKKQEAKSQDELVSEMASDILRELPPLNEHRRPPTRARLQTTAV